jgi:lysozyme family protein
MRASYDEALKRLLVHEGGYSNHPSDPGGATNFGITIADYRRYVKANATTADVRAMRVDEAKAIYRKQYWDAIRCDELSAGLDYAMFDFGVNSGISRAVKFLQRLLGLTADGRMTDATLAAVRKRDAAELVARLCDERLAFLKKLKTWPVFGAGWGRRVAEVRSAALAMARSPAMRPAPPAAAPNRPGALGSIVSALLSAWRRWRQGGHDGPVTGERS